MLAVFGLDAAYPEANLRHFAFLLEGLAVARRDLERRGVQLAVLRAPADEAALSLAGPAALLVCDRGYLRHQRAWRARVAAEAPCAVEQVEGDVVVPLEAASRKAEWAAATLRPKILRLRDRYLAAARAGDSGAARAGIRSACGCRGTCAISAPGSWTTFPVDRSVAPVPGHPGRHGRGPRATGAVRRPARWPGTRTRTAIRPPRRIPASPRTCTSARSRRCGSPSPSRAARAPRAAKEAFLEQLVVRRELAANLALFNDRCDRYDGVPGWALATLAAHARDPRPHRYGPADLEAARTHDPYWNAAMRAMRRDGFLHNHLRMYWGKKILEWSATPEEGFRTALALNNRWFLDGRDPNSLAGVAWVFGTHDRAWAERPIFGKIRYMNDAGLRRKFDADGWAASVPPLSG